MLVKEKDEGGYKADYDERGVDRGCFCWPKMDEGGYKVDYGERVGERCFLLAKEKG